MKTFKQPRFLFWLLVLSSNLIAYNNCGAGSRAGMVTKSTAAGLTGLSVTSMAFLTTAQAINAGATPVTLTWDLSRQLVRGTYPISGIPGAQFSISVQTVTLSNGSIAYLFNEPAVIGGGTSMEVQNIGLVINGVATAPTAYATMDRFIPPNPATRTLSQTAQTVMVTPNAIDTLAISFGKIATADFDPPTYTQLLSSTGVFGMNCVSCHSGASPAGGMDITNWANLIAMGVAVPYAPANSLIYQRITNSIGTGFMPPPPNPVLPSVEVQMVRDWILDGAPNN